jgi:hypothetical protein
MADDFVIVDVHDWEVHDLEPMGGKPKRWVVQPETGDLWLFKEVDRVNARGVPVGEDWAEKIVSEVARHADVAVAMVELAISGGTRGTISRTIRSLGEDLVHGNELLFGQNTGYPKDANFGEWYTVRASMDALLARSVKEPATGGDGCASFAEYLLLDALVANSDRHHQNWAVLVDADGLARMAPSFDHGSSLGFLLDDQERARRLRSKDRGFTVDAWASRGKSPFFFDGRRQTMLDAALEGTRLSNASVSGFVARVDVPTAIAAIDRVPMSIMSDAAKDFARQLVTVNYRRMGDLTDDAR